jgi:fibronectin type 3 domain-containing protein
MKNALKLIVITALVAVIGFTACATGGSTSKGLAAPSGLTATAVSSTEIQLRWDAIAGAAGYNVYQSQSSSSEFRLLGKVTRNGASNSNLPPNTTVYYKVAALAENGAEGAMSNVVSAATPSP